MQVHNLAEFYGTRDEKLFLSALICRLKPAAREGHSCCSGLCHPRRSRWCCRIPRKWNRDTPSVGHYSTIICPAVATRYCDVTAPCGLDLPSGHPANSTEGDIAACRARDVRSYVLIRPLGSTATDQCGEGRVLFLSRKRRDLVLRDGGFI